MNPCPCGYYGDKGNTCHCSTQAIEKYTRKISGPLLDRIDIHIRVPRVNYEDLSSKRKAESSESIRARVSRARDIQVARLKKYNIFCNAQMNHAMVQEFCNLTEDAEKNLKEIFESKKLSARSYDRIKKVARTIADLDNATPIITARHIGEAINLRSDLEFNN